MSFLSILPVVILAINSIKSEEKILNIMGLLPMTGEKWPGGAACLTASEMAARHINERHDVLKEFTLDLYLQDGASPWPPFIPLLRDEAQFVATVRHSLNKVKEAIAHLNSGSCDYHRPAYLFSCQAGEDKTLNIMGLLPMTGEKWPGGAACLTASLMAARHIKEYGDILKGFTLNLTLQDGACDIGLAINSMYAMLYSKPTKHMILGPGCSEVLEVAAQMTPNWNITHITYGGASPLLSDRQIYPRLFKIEAPDSRFNLARIALSRHFNWKKVATMNVALDYFSAVTDSLVQEVKGSDISIISQEIFDQDPLTRVQNLKQRDARIIMTASYENHAKRVLCAAYQVGLYGPKIVWMFPGWYKDKWWEDTQPEVNCTNEQMALVAEGSILTGNMYENMGTERGIANLTVSEYKHLYKQEETYRPEMVDYEVIGPKCYDVVWAIALTFNCTDRVLKEIGHPKSLHEFEFDRDIGDIVTACVYNVSFLGITGQVKFERSGDPMRNIKIDQIQGGKKVMVGIYWTDVEEWFLEWFNGGIIWQNDVVPRDSTLLKGVEVIIPTNEYIVMVSFAGFGIILALFFFTFNIIYRSNVYIKLSSPNINNVLLLGCVITYTSVFMESLQGQSAILCKLRTFTFTIGFSMAFGALFSKTWRVYRIFSNKKLLKLRIRDFQLVGIVLVLVLILCFVLLLWEFVDPLFIVKRPLDKEAYLIEEDDALVRPYISVCTSHYSSYFSWTIYILEGTLLSFGAFLAFETRKVHIEALNDSQFIGMCLYNVVVLSVVGLTLNLILDDQPALLYGITSGVLIIGTTATQLVVFVPKVMAVFRPHHHDGSKLSASQIHNKRWMPRDPDPISTISSQNTHGQ